MIYWWLMISFLLMLFSQLGAAADVRVAGREARRWSKWWLLIPLLVLLHLPPGLFDPPANGDDVADEAGGDMADESGDDVADEAGGEVADEAGDEVADEDGGEVAGEGGGEVANGAGVDLAALGAGNHHMVYFYVFVIGFFFSRLIWNYVAGLKNRGEVLPGRLEMWWWIIPVTISAMLAFKLLRDK